MGNTLTAESNRTYINQVKKRVLVTGATGFIGNHVVLKLLAQNHTVIATGKYLEKAKQFSWYSDTNFIPCDLNTEIDDFYTYFEKPDTVIHLAWEGLPNYDASFHVEVNLINNYKFIKNLINNGLHDITVAGTCYEYGLQEGLLSEDMQTKPCNSYAIAKDTLRIHMEQLQSYYQFNLKWIRLFYLHGTGQNKDSLLAQLETALNNQETHFNMSGGEQLRDYLPIETAAQYITSIAMQENITGIINCCSGSPITVKQLVQDYLNKQNKTIHLNLGYYPYPKHEPMAFWGDRGKLDKILKEES